MMGRAWALNETELVYLFEYLKEMNLVKGGPGFIDVTENYSYFDVSIAPSGWEKIATIKNEKIVSNQGFVAMWFSDLMDKIYRNAIFNAIKNSGFIPVVMSHLEHIDRIDDRIMVEIKKSRFVIADFTGQRGGVYFEAGYALGLNIPVIWTCEKEEMKKMHFDIRQYNCLDWTEDNVEDFRARLQARILNTVGRGTSSVE